MKDGLPRAIVFALLGMLLVALVVGSLWLAVTTWPHSR